jgi:hypothetical protein
MWGFSALYGQRFLQPDIRIKRSSERQKLISLSGLLVWVAVSKKLAKDKSQLGSIV